MAAGGVDAVESAVEDLFAVPGRQGREDGGEAPVVVTAGAGQGDALGDGEQVEGAVETLDQAGAGRGEMALADVVGGAGQEGADGGGIVAQEAPEVGVEPVRDDSGGPDGQEQGDEPARQAGGEGGVGGAGPGPGAVALDGGGALEAAGELVEDDSGVAPGQGGEAGQEVAEIGDEGARGGLVGGGEEAGAVGVGQRQAEEDGGHVGATRGADPVLQGAALLQGQGEVSGGEVVRPGDGTVAEGAHALGVADGPGRGQGETGVIIGAGGEAVEEGPEGGVGGMVAGEAHEGAHALDVREGWQLPSQGLGIGKGHGARLPGGLPLLAADDEALSPSRPSRFRARPQAWRAWSISATSKAISRDCWWLRRGSTRVS
ncbi:hypothetical protein ADENT20671_0827 [Actinomyces denticolens]|nr:hypothetical protein ADENT20671_0827 [Actinomyces denticolens]